MLGDTVKKYESGNSGISTISSGNGDPGGKSYGTYQLASKTGTLQAFIKQSPFKADFSGLVPGSAKFDAQWLYIARTSPEALKTAEWQFIKKTHFDKARSFATSKRLPSTPAIDEAIWSMSIQHGKVNTIIANAVASLPKEVTEKQIVNALYDARAKYIGSLKGLSPSLKKNLVKNRTIDERKDVIKLV